MYTDEQKAAIRDLLTIARLLFDDWDEDDSLIIEERSNRKEADRAEHAQTRERIQSRIDALERVLFAMPVVFCVNDGPPLVLTSSSTYKPIPCDICGTVFTGMYCPRCRPTSLRS